MCKFEKGCHENCDRCDDFYKLEEEIEDKEKYIKVLEEKCRSYEEDRYGLLEANWELVKQKTDLQYELEEKQNRIINLETTIKVLKGE